MSSRLVFASPILRAVAPPSRTSHCIPRTPYTRTQVAPRRAYSSPNRFRPQAHIQRSAINWTSVAVYVAFGAISIVGVGVYRGYSTSPLDLNLSDLPPTSDDNMAPQLAAGRPGTLSPQEEAKLRELWALMLQVSGVMAKPQTTANGASSTSSPALSRTPSESGEGTPEKKKKSRLSFLKGSKKKYDEKENHHVPSTSAPGHSAPASGVYARASTVCVLGKEC
jgi:hypothetical protein